MQVLYVRYLLSTKTQLPAYFPLGAMYLPTTMLIASRARLGPARI